MLALRAGSRWQDEDARIFAARRAGVLLADKDRAFFQALELYPDLTTYNAAQLSGLGDPETLYPTGAGWDWRWASEADWQRYRRMRRDARRLKNWATLALGGVVAGRLVGAATALIGGIRDREGAGGERTGSGSGRLTVHRRAGDRLELRLEPWFAFRPDDLRGLRLRVSLIPGF
jgi:hypothetical protein